jgi:hypothetical protein
VRAAPLALPQSAGTRFIGTGLALPLAPGAQPHTTGSRLRLWSGDADPATAAYHNYPPQRPVPLDRRDHRHRHHHPARLLDAFRAYFFGQIMGFGFFDP